VGHLSQSFSSKKLLILKWMGKSEKIFCRIKNPNFEFWVF
jgi:hypothetical protein